MRTEADLRAAAGRDAREGARARSAACPPRRRRCTRGSRARVPMDGYRIEKLLFESQPGLLRHGAPLRARRARGPEAGRAPPLRPLAGRQGVRATTRRSAAVSRSAATSSSRGTPSARASAASSGTRRAKRSRYNLVCGEHAVLGNLATLAGTSLVRYEVWDGIRARRLPADAPRGGRPPRVDHRHERRRLPVDVDRRARRAHRRRRAVVLRHVAAAAHGEPHLRGPGQRPRAGPARPRVRGRRPRRACCCSPTRAPIHVAAAVRDFVPIEGARRTVARAARALRAPRPRRPRRLRAGRPPAPLLRREPGEARSTFLDRWNGLAATRGSPPSALLPPEALQVTPTRAGARRPRRPLARRRHPRGRPRACGGAPADRRWPRSTQRPQRRGRARELAERVGSSASGDVTIDRYLVRAGGLVDAARCTSTATGAAAGRVVLLALARGQGRPGRVAGSRRAPLARRRGGGLRPARAPARTGCATAPSSVDDPAIAPADEAAAYVDPLSGVLANHVVQRAPHRPAVPARGDRRRRRRRPLQPRDARREEARRRRPSATPTLLAASAARAAGARARE